MPTVQCTSAESRIIKPLVSEIDRTKSYPTYSAEFLPAALFRSTPRTCCVSCSVKPVLSAAFNESVNPQVRSTAHSPSILEWCGLSLQWSLPVLVSTIVNCQAADSKSWLSTYGLWLLKAPIGLSITMRQMNRSRALWLDGVPLFFIAKV